MYWKKSGVILDEKKAKDFGLYNVQVPYARIHDKFIRVYFGARREDNRAAEIYFIDVLTEDPTQIINFSQNPVLKKGDIGCFDQDGILPVCIIQVIDKTFLYYGGFAKTETHPHFCMMGLAISTDHGKTFNRFSKGPILPISTVDPYLIGSADILKTERGFEMIYTSGTRWKEIAGSWELCYSLKYATSSNGIDWTRDGKLLLDNEENHYAIAKPSIFSLNEKHFLAYSIRGISDYKQKGLAAYKIKFKESKDLKNWVDTIEFLDFLPSASGWDSEMVCYPNIINTPNRILMLYNGNGFGKSGFGFAELIKE